MIDFLRESRFAVKEVISKAWLLLKEHYFSIAGLCFLMFLTFSASSILAFFLRDVNRGLSIVMAFSFAMVYFSLNLTLFKYIFFVMDANEDKTLIESLPTAAELTNFLIATIYFFIFTLVVYIFFAALLFPLIWVVSKFVHGYNQVLIDIALSIVAFLIFFVWLRISFFPFFIIDRKSKPFESIRLSFAITRGNFVKILVLLLVLGIFYGVSLYLSYIGYPVVAAITTLVSSFLIVPLSSVALTVAYRKMMSEYKGDAHPDFIHNIL